MKKIIAVVVFILFGHYCVAQAQCGSPVRKQYPTKNLAIASIDVTKIDSIPVIFHVLYKNAGENIADSFLIALLQTTALDMMAANDDIALVPDVFKQFVGNPNIVLCLADQLPDGTATTGIIRQKTQTQVFKYNRREAFLESKLIDPRSYLNVYVCDVNPGTNAFTPGSDLYDGIVIDYTKVRRASRTLTHEIGHWLDIRHIYLSGCSNGDGIADTPAQKQTPSGTCPKHPRITCTKPSMFMNYMDYSSCRYFFTAGQVQKMKDYIIKYKNFR
jgi:hypothetical protein